MDDRKPPKARRFVESVMTIAKPVLVVDGAGLGIAALGALFVEHRVACAAFVAAGRVVGIVSSNDLARTRRIVRDQHALVTDVMAHAAPIPPTHTILESAADLATANLDYLVVVSEGRPVGVVHACDVLAWFARRHGIRSAGFPASASLRSNT